MTLDGEGMGTPDLGWGRTWALIWRRPWHLGKHPSDLPLVNGVWFFRHPQQYNRYSWLLHILSHPNGVPVNLIQPSFFCSDLTGLSMHRSHLPNSLRPHHLMPTELGACDFGGDVQIYVRIYIYMHRYIYIYMHRYIYIYIHIYA